MFDVCNVVKNLLKYKRINTDNNIFQLHYKLTVAILLIFALLVMSKQFFGDPIDCETDNSAKKVMDTYCWIYSTFTVKAHLNNKYGGSIYPGVGPYQNIMRPHQSDSIISQKYYQWVCIVLFLQGALFYFPKYLWRRWEGGRIKTLVKDFDLPVLQKKVKEDYVQFLVDYMMTNRNVHNMYLARFVVCEILNFCNVVFQIFAMNLFLGGHFSGYGIAVSVFSQNSTQVNPMSKVFPKLAKCTYANFGPSGSIQTLDALCVLPLNVVNEKIYIIIWFWFMILATISGLGILYRLFLITSQAARTYLLIAQTRVLDKNVASNIVSYLSVGDWFVLYQLGKNFNLVLFQVFISTLYNNIIGQKGNKKYVYQFQPNAGIFDKEDNISDKN